MLLNGAMKWMRGTREGRMEGLRGTGIREAMYRGA